MEELLRLLRDGYDLLEKQDSQDNKECYPSLERMSYITRVKLRLKMNEVAFDTLVDNVTEAAIFCNFNDTVMEKVVGLVRGVVEHRCEDKFFAIQVQKPGVSIRSRSWGIHDTCLVSLDELMSSKIREMWRNDQISINFA